MDEYARGTSKTFLLSIAFSTYLTLIEGNVAHPGLY